MYNSSQNLDVKLDMPDFEGKSHFDELIDRLYTVELVFDIKNLSDEQKVNVSAYMFLMFYIALQFGFC